MAVGKGSASRRNKRLLIERPVRDTSFEGAGSGTWARVGEVWASVVDVLPSRGERLSEGLNIATRPARVRMRHRSDITPDMRLSLLNAGQPIRVMQIVAGPAAVEETHEIEFMVEEYRPAGNGA